MRLFLILLIFSTSVLAQGFSARWVADDLAQSSQGKPAGYVFDITVNNIDQLSAVLNRADKLQSQFSPQDRGRIALVLHGEELNLFRKKNYSQFMSIVDKARQLDSQHLVDIKACKTMMNIMQIEQSELPDFIEQVPLAPAEIERLVQERGYTRL